MYARTQAALHRGATAKEIPVAASVAVPMSGRPGMLHSRQVMNAREAFNGKN